MELVYVIPQRYNKGKPIDRFEKEHKLGSCVLSKKFCKELSAELTIIPSLKNMYNNLNNRFLTSADTALFLNNGEDSFVVIDEELDVHEMIYAFFAKKDDFISLSDFSLACAYKKHSFAIDYYNKKDPKSIGYIDICTDAEYIKKCIDCLTPQMIESDCFIAKEDYINGYSKGLFMRLPKEELKASISLEDEWNSIFICAKFADFYVGYWWQTSA